MKHLTFTLLIALGMNHTEANIIRELLAVTHPIYTHDRVMERDAREKEVEEVIFHREFDSYTLNTIWEKNINRSRRSSPNLDFYMNGYFTPIILTLPKE